MNYKEKLASVLKQASFAISGNKAMSKDLLTASVAIEKMPNEKFASQSNSDALIKMFEERKPLLDGKPGVDFTIPRTEVQDTEKDWNKNASEKGSKKDPVIDPIDSKKPLVDGKPGVDFKNPNVEVQGEFSQWNKKAAILVQKKLAELFGEKKAANTDIKIPGSVPGAKLAPKETPDGKCDKAGTVTDTPENTGAKLEVPKETGDLSKTLNSNMVKETSTPVKKEASKEKETDKKDKKAKVGKKNLKVKKASVNIGISQNFEGIEIPQNNIDPVSLSASDAKLLGSLFDTGFEK